MSDDAVFSVDNSDLRVRKAQGVLSIYEGDDLILAIESFSYAEYKDCVLQLVSAPPIPLADAGFPSFIPGYLHLNGYAPQNEKFIDFLSGYENKIVFLNIYMLSSLEIFDDYVSTEICGRVYGNTGDVGDIVMPITSFEDVSNLMENKWYDAIEAFVDGLDSEYLEKIMDERCSPYIQFSDDTDFRPSDSKGLTVTGFFRVELPSPMGFGHRTAIRLIWVEANASDWRRALE